MEDIYELEPIEQLKIAYKLLESVENDIHYNAENENDTKTINTIVTMILQLKEIIKEYDTNEII